MRDRFSLVIFGLAGFLIVFMVTSVFYLYIAAGRTWDLVGQTLLDQRVLGALFISVSSSTLVALLAVAAVIPASYVLATRDFRGKGLVETLLVEFPQTFPPAAVGLVYLLMLGPTSPVHLAYSFIAVIIAKFYVSAPFAMSLVMRRFKEIRASGLDTIARTLGADTRQVLLWVMVPMSKTDLLAGFTLTWARAMGEVAATLIFAGAIPWRTEIFPSLVYLTSISSPQLALAASVIAATLSIAALLAFKWVAGAGR